MKLLVCLALCLAVALAEENPRRLEIIKIVNEANTTWRAGVNSRFAEQPMSAVVGQLGSLEGGPVLEVKNIAPLKDLPTDFDPTTKWTMCPSLDEIRDQGPCGSCWAFGAAEAATDRLCIASNGKHQERLSSEDLLSCCEWCGSGCEGGFPSSAWSWFASTGVVTGGVNGDTKYCSPYAFPFCAHHVQTPKYSPCPPIQPTPSCKKECVNGATYSEDKHYFKQAYSVPSDVDSLKTELYTNGPIEVSFTVYEDFEAYKGGVYQHTTGSALGGHAVKMVGWGVDGGVEYWKIANSWNTSWGERGYFRIIAGQDECGIESSGVAGEPKL
jgi:cathepsin B